MSKRKRQVRSFRPEERLGTLKISSTGKSLILTIDDLQLGRAQKEGIEKWWRISVKHLNALLNNERPYIGVYLSTLPPGAKIQQEIEEEERLLSLEEAEPEETEEST